MKINPKILTMLLALTFTSTVIPASQINVYAAEKSITSQYEETLEIEENLDFSINDSNEVADIIEAEEVNEVEFIDKIEEINEKETYIDNKENEVVQNEILTDNEEECIEDGDFTRNVATCTGTGRIVKFDDNKGLKKVTVNIRRGSYNISGEIAATAVTDKNGIFTTKALPTGNYTIQIKGEGIVTTYIFAVRYEGSTSNFGDIEVDVTDDYVEEVSVGTISGSVRNAVNYDGINKARIIVDDEKEYSTNSDGSFSIEVESDTEHKLTIEKEGYLTEEYHNVKVSEDNKNNLALILQVPESSKDTKCTAEGRILESSTGKPASNITVKVRKGINAKQGKIFTETISNEDGRFSAENLPNGNYTAELTSDNTVTTYLSFTCFGSSVNMGDISVTPSLNPNEMRIVLTWGKNPMDLDAVMSGEGHYVSYMNKEDKGMVLEVNDSSSYGPETIKMDLNEIVDGVYKYSVKWYYGNGTWITSNAKVTVYLGTKVLGEFYAPNNFKYEEVWNVFEFDTTTKELKTL